MSDKIDIQKKVVNDNIANQINRIAIGGILILSCFFIASSYLQQVNTKEQNHLSYLSTISKTISLDIDGDRYKKLLQQYSSKDQITSNDQDKTYLDIQQKLKKSVEKNRLKTPIYILSKTPNKASFFVGVSSADQPNYRHLYSKFPEQLNAQYSTGGTVGLYEDKNETWLSAFETIKTVQGNVVGVLMIDSLHPDFYAEAKATALKNILFSLLILGFTLLLLNQYLKQIISILRAKEKAEQQADIKAKFLSTMSHEIRTPMNAVVGLSNILLEENPRPDQKENINTLKFSADLLLALINDILDFSKIEAGKISFEHIDFNLPKLVQNIGNSLRSNANKKQLDLKINIDPRIPTQVIGDPVRLSQILTNLSGNAIKFTEAGSVNLNIKLVTNNMAGHMIRFSIVDTGIGISKDKFQTIFKSFSQADTDTTRKYGGTGLGLSITKKLLELQDSTIQLESTIGKGSTFFFDLQMGQSTQSEAATKISPQKETNSITDFKGAKVLLVEDNKINVLVATKFLTKWGMRVVVAENGKDALEKVQKEVFQIVLMDLDMPIMDGYEATRLIRSLSAPIYKDLPIIALSASAVADFKTKAFQVGMNAFITKPFIPQELSDCLAKHIQKMVV